MPSPKKITSSRELAKLAGVSHVTVARAFKNDPKILPETKERILKLAKKHGYRPNPVHRLHALAKGQNKTTKAQGTLALIQQNENLQSLAERPWLAPYLVGVKRQAARLGFSIDEFSLHRNAYSPEQLHRALYARGIQGLIFAAAPSTVREVNFNWSNYSSVAIEQSGWRPLLHRVLKDTVHAISTTLSEVNALGFKRVGLAISRREDESSRYATKGVMLAHQEKMPAKNRVPTLVYHSAKVEEVSTEVEGWIQRYKPDCIITGDSQMLPLVESMGLRVPTDIALVHTAIRSDVANWTGYCIDSEAIGAAAVDMVVSRIVRNEIGLPSDCRDLYLRGKWQVGDTT